MDLEGNAYSVLDDDSDQEAFSTSSPTFAVPLRNTLSW